MEKINLDLINNKITVDENLLKGFEIGIFVNNIIARFDIPLIRDPIAYAAVKVYPLLLKRASKHDIYVHITPEHIYMGPYTRSDKKLKRTIVMMYLELLMKSYLQLETKKLDIALLLNDQEEMWLRVPSIKVYGEDDFVFESSCNDKDATHYVKRSLKKQLFDLTMMNDEQRNDLLMHMYFRYIFGIGGAYSSNVYICGENMFALHMGLKSKPRAVKMFINLLFRNPTPDECEILPRYFHSFPRFNDHGEYCFIEMMKTLRNLGVGEGAIFQIKERRKVFEDCLHLLSRQCDVIKNISLSNLDENKIDDE